VNGERRTVNGFVDIIAGLLGLRGIEYEDEHETIGKREGVRRDGNEFQGSRTLNVERRTLNVFLLDRGHVVAAR
jgi:hypothetical protein